LRYATLLAILTAIAGGEAFAESEGVSGPEGLYWAATTMTTAGYGDSMPKTNTGRAVAVAHRFRTPNASETSSAGSPTPSRRATSTPWSPC
jgi:hypothetical protein